MKKILVGILVGIVGVFLLQYIQRCTRKNDQIIENTALIQEHLKNVSKLVVTEGYFSEIITYTDAKKYLADLISFDKKALIVVNAEATISYDMSQIAYEIDSENKRLIINNIPEPELKIYPQLSYYDLVQSQFNTFTSQDHNKIRQKANEIVRQKIDQSTLKSNAESRLISELSKLLVLTNSMNWTLQYEGRPIFSEKEIMSKKN
ncbi:DUF4230 domain-containing protein [Capnocytophaga catalasegens]|uniref:DUF4230 domain-containing protein n=1 Tax=Capnocytophaga catalasegens TaxID=1004260 RepID=A0AAV5AXQ7_9FLAO|nr:DUF4230 domain-containing protein [Capnocytophaga catalasegens]GIZ16552.1 hypothetical protein RCZ03_25520 [Capnocytophaga catalasegens]GJM51384.1 hypothetical protein RCZ15_23570 [Capnocytophaga catalasegens]GJM54288.1 hypothetical protein RCZ16_26040 [Capnocytophaga catalasegens]